jgi:Cytidylyltransferase-like
VPSPFDENAAVDESSGADFIEMTTRRSPSIPEPDLTMALGAYPGSFNPPTIAHLAIARAAYERYDLERVDWVVSRIALGKEDVTVPTFGDRVAVLEEIVATRPWLALHITDDRLIADMVAGYDLVILGADKWAQVIDPSWYGSDAGRDAAVARLPQIALVPRPGYPRPDNALLIENVPADVSSSGARAGTTEWMAPEAADFDRRTGAWTDPERYRHSQRTTPRPRAK